MSNASVAIKAKPNSKPKPKAKPKPTQRPFSVEERIHYRDRLREARYSALANAEGFAEICFVVEALGRRLLGQEETFGNLKDVLEKRAKSSTGLSGLPSKFPQYFGNFGALLETLHKARNDAMHTGAYARHATAKAIELCMVLEDALMANRKFQKIAGNYMVRSPVSIEPWQPVARARQLMLTHSFSFLPIFVEGKWKLLSELALAKFLQHKDRNERMALPLSEAINQSPRLELLLAKTVPATEPIEALLTNAKDMSTGDRLWLVVSDDVTDSSNPSHLRLVGVLSPFELM